METFANRGLAGIDGNISTAIGIALNRKKTFAVIGDLAFLHDINGLLLGPEEVQPDLIILVISNDGGGIFSTLPQNGVAGFERILVLHMEDQSQKLPKVMEFRLSKFARSRL